MFVVTRHCSVFTVWRECFVFFSVERHYISLYSHSQFSYQEWLTKAENITVCLRNTNVQYHQEGTEGPFIFFKRCSVFSCREAVILCVGRLCCHGVACCADRTM